MNNPLLDRYQANRLPHALILVGQSAMAGQLIEAFTASLKLNPADYLSFTENRPLKIAEARQIKQFSEKTRFTSPIKLVFIQYADQLTPEAGNALLKTLEEPPAGTHLLLTSQRPENILATIRSRCQLLTLSPASDNSSSLDIAPLSRKSLAEYFSWSKELASSDIPLPTLFEHWLSNNLSIHWQRIILHYLGPAQTTVNRRLLLDNFFLEIYNTD